MKEYLYTTEQAKKVAYEKRKQLHLMVEDIIELEKAYTITSNPMLFATTDKESLMLACVGTPIDTLAVVTQVINRLARALDKSPEFLLGAMRGAMCAIKDSEEIEEIEDSFEDFLKNFTASMLRK